MTRLDYWRLLCEMLRNLKLARVAGLSYLVTEYETRIQLCSFYYGRAEK